MPWTDEQKSGLKLRVRVMIINVLVFTIMRECDQLAPYFNHFHLSISDQRCLVAACNKADVLQEGMCGVDSNLVL